MNENNIFKFAPNELVQDAFLCWLFNEKEEQNIKEVAHNILRNILRDAKEKGRIKENIENINLEEIKILPQEKVVVDNYKIYDEQIKGIFKKRENLKKIPRRIDILIIIDEKYAIIIEDKVDTSEHGFQLIQYKQALECKYRDKKYTILTCYYKIFDECNLKNKENYVDSIMNRQRILKELNKIETKNRYFNDYKEYLKKIDETSNNYEKEAENVNNYLRKNKILDIRYLGLLKSINGQYWEKSTEGPKYTWWCNTDIMTQIKSENRIFWDHFFLKINFYEKEKMKISLRIGKRWNNINEGGVREENTCIKYMLNEEKGNIEPKYCDISKIFNKEEVFEELKNKNIFYKIYNKLKQSGILEDCQGYEKVKQEGQKLKDCEKIFIPRKNQGKDQKYELTIFTIQTKLDIGSKDICEKTKKFIEIINEEMNEIKVLDTIIKHTNKEQ